jgi:hypothetical protein
MWSPLVSGACPVGQVKSCAVARYGHGLAACADRVRWLMSGTTNSTTRWSSMWWLASASSISTRCGPGGRFWMMTGTPLASAQSQGRSSTVTWRCPMRGETASAAGPNTGTIRMFSARYWRTTTPRASASASGGSTKILAGGCVPGSDTTPAAVVPLAAAAPRTLLWGLREGTRGASHHNHCKQHSHLAPRSCNVVRRRRMRPDCSVHPSAWLHGTLGSPRARTPRPAPKFIGTVVHCGLHRVDRSSYGVPCLPTSNRPVTPSDPPTPP